MKTAKSFNFNLPKLARTLWRMPSAPFLARLFTAATFSAIVIGSLAGCSGDFKQRLNSLGSTIDKALGVEANDKSAPQISRAEQIYREAKDKEKAGNSPQALVLYREAADMGHAAAAYELGQAYAEGRGVSLDLEESAKWINHAAEAGDPRAQYLIGSSYFQGTGVPQDYETAVTYLAKAATQGHSAAQHLLGEAFANGYGVAKDVAWAARWYGKAANQGNIDAQFAYGAFWATGRGLPKDEVEGYTWFLRAARSGNRQAQELAGRLRAKISAEEATSAQQAAAKFKARSSRRFSDPPTVIYVQHTLNEFGFDAGAVDGKFGPQTSAAISRFQKSRNGAADGRLSPTLLNKLLAESRRSG